jgi:hypothetical protein
MEVSSNQLVNLVEDQEANFRSVEATRCREKSVEFLWGSTDNVWHVLLKMTKFLG